MTAQMIIGGSQESGSEPTTLHPTIEHIVASDLERGCVQRFALIVIRGYDETAVAVIIDRSYDVGRILHGDNRALFGDLKIVVAVGGLPDALAEEQCDPRIVNPLLIVVPVTVSPEGNFARLNRIETCTCHNFIACGCP